MIVNQIKTKFDHEKIGFKCIDDMLDSYNIFNDIAVNYAHVKQIPFDEWYDAMLDQYKESHVLDGPNVPLVQSTQ